MAETSALRSEGDHALAAEDRYADPCGSGTEIGFYLGCWALSLWVRRSRYGCVAGTPSWSDFKENRHEGIFDTDFDKYTDDAVALFTKSGVSTAFD